VRSRNADAFSAAQFGVSLALSEILVGPIRA